MRLLLGRRLVLQTDLALLLMSLADRRRWSLGQLVLRRGSAWLLVVLAGQKHSSAV